MNRKTSFKKRYEICLYLMRCEPFSSSMGAWLCELIALVVGSPDGIKQRSANNSSQAKSVPQSVSVNKALLKHSHDHSLTQCL